MYFLGVGFGIGTLLKIALQVTVIFIVVMMEII